MEVHVLVGMQLSLILVASRAIGYHIMFCEDPQFKVSWIGRQPDKYNKTNQLAQKLPKMLQKKVMVII